jgi:hypothetical protein
MNACAFTRVRRVLDLDVDSKRSHIVGHDNTSCQVGHNQFTASIIETTLGQCKCEASGHCHGPCHLGILRSLH